MYARVGDSAMVGARLDVGVGALHEAVGLEHLQGDRAQAQHAVDIVPKILFRGS